MASPTIQFVGNLTGDPELRFTKSGKPVANFSVACNKKRYDELSREWVDDTTTFLRCTAWDNLGRNVCDTLTKGMCVTGKGSLQQVEYTTRGGEQRTDYQVTVDEIGPSLAFATANVQRNPREGQPQQGGQSQATGWAVQDKNAGFGGGQAGDDEPPF